MKLYRPVGVKELQLIAESNYTAFPPRLPEQPIFYPVLNSRYAEEIAQRWNTKDKNSGNKGYVTEFEIDDDYISRFEVHTVGASYHKELWIPCEELNNFNFVRKQLYICFRMIFYFTFMSEYGIIILYVFTLCIRRC